MKQMYCELVDTCVFTRETKLKLFLNNEFVLA